MTKLINESPVKETRPLTSQMSGDLLSEIKQLAADHYLQLKIGTKAEFEKMWRDAFSITD